MRAHLLILLVFLAAPFLANGQTLSFEGLRQFEEESARKALQDQWREIETRGLTASRANDAAFFLRLALRQQGFSEAVVDPFRSGNELRLKVTEGRRLTLGDIRLLGIKNLKEDRIKEALVKEMKQRQNLLEVSSELPYVPEAIERAVGAVEGYGQFEGYLQTTAELDPAGPPNANGKVDVTLRVNEGPLFVIAAVVLQGEHPALLQELDPIAKEEVGKPLNVANVRTLQGSIIKELESQGYFDARCEVLQGHPSDMPETTQVTVVMEVDPGPLYHVSEVHVSGHQELSGSFIKERFNAMLGQPYDPAAVRKIYREFAQAGLFDNMEITPVPQESGQLALEVAVEEAKFQQIGFYGGVGSFEGPILGTRYTDRNFFGTGREFRGQVEWNGRGLLGELNYLDRWFLDSRWQFGVQLFVGTQHLLGYDKWEAGLTARFTYPFTDHTSISFYGKFSHVSLTDNRFVDVDIGPEDYQVEAFGVTFLWDHRQDLEPEGYGSYFELSLEHGTSLLLGDVSYLRGQARWAYYWRLPLDSELRVGARVGLMQGIGDTSIIPADLRYFNGGGQSVRSFPERELGAQDRRHHPLGGEFYTTFNLEYTFPIKDAFRMAVFADAGNLLTRMEDVSLDDMHYAAGLGLRYDLPLGPLRADYGFNLNREKGEPKGSFHLGFGFAF